MVSIATHNALLKNEDVVTKILTLNFNTWYQLNVKTKVFYLMFRYVYYQIWIYVNINENIRK